jgi:ribosomal protein S18 acetylase RimI-like enzyme
MRPTPCPDVKGALHLHFRVCGAVLFSDETLDLSGMRLSEELQMTTIRLAQTKDATAVVRLISEMARVDGDSSPIDQEYVAYYLSCPHSYVLLAEEEGQVIGLLSYSIRPNLYHAGDACFIEQLIVQENARGRGVGGALVEELLRRLAALDCVEVSVSAMPDNQGAIRFYKSHGLTEEVVLLERHFGLVG